MENFYDPTSLSVLLYFFVFFSQARGTVIGYFTPYNFDITAESAASLLRSDGCLLSRVCATAVHKKFLYFGLSISPPANKIRKKASKIRTKIRIKNRNEQSEQYLATW